MQTLCFCNRNVCAIANQGRASLETASAEISASVSCKHHFGPGCWHRLYFGIIRSKGWLFWRSFRFLHIKHSQNILEMLFFSLSKKINLSRGLKINHQSQCLHVIFSKFISKKKSHPTPPAVYLRAHNMPAQPNILNLTTSMSCLLKVECGIITDKTRLGHWQGKASMPDWATFPNCNQRSYSV